MAVAPCPWPSWAVVMFLGWAAWLKTPIHAGNWGSLLQTFISKDSSLAFTSAVCIWIRSHSYCLL